MNTRFHTVLSTSANICIVLLTVIVIGSVVRQYSLGHTSSSRNVHPHGLSIGDKAPSVPGLSYSNTSSTLLLFIRPHCVACIQSLSDYKALAATNMSRGTRIVGIAMKRDAKELGAYEQLGFPFPVSTVDSFDTYGIAGTPFLVLVNQNGVVTDLWIGKLTPDVVRRIASLLGGTA